MSLSARTLQTDQSADLDIHGTKVAGKAGRSIRESRRRLKYLSARNTQTPLDDILGQCILRLRHPGVYEWPRVNTPSQKWSSSSLSLVTFGDKSDIGTQSERMLGTKRTFSDTLHSFAHFCIDGGEPFKSPEGTFWGHSAKTGPVRLVVGSAGFEPTTLAA